MSSSVMTDDTVFIPLKKPETDAQAFAGLVHGLYLSIFHPTSACVKSEQKSNRQRTLIDQRISRLIFADGFDLLARSSDLRVREIADQYTSPPATGYPRLFAVADLVALSVRCQASSTTRALMSWVTVAYGASLPRTDTVTLYTVLPCGSLLALPDRLFSITESDCADAFRKPPFWRWLHVVTCGCVDQDDVLSFLCRTILAHVALPTIPFWEIEGAGITEFTLPNIVRMLMTMETFSQQNVSTSSSMLNSLSWSTLITLGLNAFYVIGIDYYKMWLSQVLTMKKSSGTYVEDRITASSLTSDYTVRLSDYNAHTNVLPPAVSEQVMAAFEALKIDKKSKDDDESSEDPDGYDAGGKDDTADDITSGTPAQSIEAPPSPDAGAAGNAIGQTPPKQGDSIDLIPLSRDTGSVNAYLYKCAVLALSTTLEQNPDIDIDSNTRQTLSEWCQSWMWIASISQTQGLIRELGLQSVLGPLSKIKG